MTNDSVLCFGEVVIDLVHHPDSDDATHIGGSLLNTACGLAQLGINTQLASWWAHDAYGTMIANHLRDNQVTVVPGSDQAHRTTIAHAWLDANGAASYQFDLEWAPDYQLDLSSAGHLHIASLSATCEPGSLQVAHYARAMHHLGKTISYDPNIRPDVMGSPEHVRETIEELVSIASIVKVSDEDLGWLYPGKQWEDIAHFWCSLGPRVVIVTRGSSGASAITLTDTRVRHFPAYPVTVADTIGAGDSFNAGLLAYLFDHKLVGKPDSLERLTYLSPERLTHAVHYASATAAITVAHHGAYAPTRAHVSEALRDDHRA